MIWEESMEGDEKAMWDRNQDNAGLQGRVSEDKKGEEHPMGFQGASPKGFLREGFSLETTRAHR